MFRSKIKTFLHFFPLFRVHCVIFVTVFNPHNNAFSTIIRSNPLGGEFRNESKTASMIAPSSTAKKCQLIKHFLPKKPREKKY